MLLAVNIQAGAVGIQAGAGAGNATGVVTAEEDAREIPVALGSQRWIFLFPHRESLRLPLMGLGGGGGVIAVLLCHCFSLPWLTCLMCNLGHDD